MKANPIGKIPSIRKIHFQAFQPLTPFIFLLIPYDSSPLNAPARVDAEKKMAARVASSWYSYQKERSVKQICLSIFSLVSQNIGGSWEMRTKCAALDEGFSSTNEKSHGNQLATRFYQYREDCKNSPLHIMQRLARTFSRFFFGKVLCYC